MIKRRHGLNRSRYRGDDGMKRWVGLGVIGDNLINISQAWPSPNRRHADFPEERHSETEPSAPAHRH